MSSTLLVGLVCAFLVITQIHAVSLADSAPPGITTKHQHAAKPHLLRNAPWRHTLKQQVTKLGLSADVTATIEESLFVKICNTVVPLINQYVQGLVIPGESQKHFSFDNVVIQQFDIQSISITFTNPSTVSLALSQISFAIPQTHFDVFTKILFIKLSCSGNFWASMSGTTISLSMAASESNGDLVFGDAQSSVSWGSLNINHDFPNFFCKIGQDIIQLFIGNINNLIKKTVENDIPAKIGPMVQAALDKALAKLPLDFVSQPQVTSDSISLTVDLLGHPAGVAKVMGPLRSARTRAIAARDLELEIPQTALNNLLLFTQQQGGLNMNFTDKKFNTSVIKTIFPAVYAQCPDCPFAIEINAIDAPFVTTTSDSIGITVTNGILGLNLAAADGSILPFVDLWVNASLSVNDVSITTANAVYFQLALGAFSLGIRASSIGPFDISLISSVAAFALQDVVIPQFNQRFKGIPLPGIASEAEVAISNSAVYVAFNVALA
jgi:hypothetical protein